MGTVRGEQVCFSVLLVPDEDDSGVCRVSVPGVDGCISSLGPPHAALESVAAALEQLLRSLPEEEEHSLLTGQPHIKPNELPRGSCLERVCVSAPALAPIRSESAA